LESFKADLNTYFYNSRSLDEWDHLFSTIKAGTLNREEIVLVASEASAVATERQINGGLVSPRKRSADEMVMQQLEVEYNTFGSFIAMRIIEGGDRESSIQTT
jgi:glycosylphosphatidylinositol transamidase (GPIT) subunit GPI8